MGRLFARICSVQTLREAWRQIERKGAQGGIDGVSVAEFAKDAEAHIHDLSRVLEEGGYSPEPAERIHTPKFNEAGEFRALSLPSIKDKVVQQAVRTVIEPFFERRFLDCSYAYRSGRGPRKAIGKVTFYVTHDKKEWAIFGDLDNFFDSLNHDQLIDEVKKVIYEPEILALIRMWVKIGAMDQRGRYHDSHWGIAQGGIISPLLSNVYAHPLDVHATGLEMAYVRYADNFVVLSHSKEEAAASLEAIRKFIEESLHLRLNPEKEPIRSLEQGFVFLGVHFRGGDRFLAGEKKDKIRRKLDWLTMKHRPHAPEKIVAELSEAIEGTRRYYGFLNPLHDFKDLDRYLLRRLRVLMIAKRQRGQIETKSELHLLLEKLPFFAATEEGEARELRRQLVQDVFSAATTERHDPKARGASGAPRSKKRPASPEPVETTCPPPTPQAAPASSPAGAHPPLPSMEPSGTAPTPEQPASSAKDREEKEARSADRKVAAKKQRYVRRGFLESELVVSTPGTFMGHRSNRLVMYRNRQKVFDAPLIKVKSILVHCRGVTVSSDLIEACAAREVPIVFSSARGYSYASVHAPLQSRPELGLLQLDAVRDGTALTWAKAFVTGKLKNQLNLLKFYHRHREDEDPEYAKKLDEAEVNLEGIQKQVRTVEIELPYEKTRDRLFGFEGQAGVHYWEMIRLLLPEDIPFPGRVHRGAKDLVNASLNLGYSLLYPRIERALLMAGLNLYTSLLHAPQVGKPTLSFDLIELFRAPVVDRAVFSLLTRGRDLNITTHGRLSSGTVQMVVEAVIGRLGTLVPYKGEKIALEQVIYKQARLLAKSLRNEKTFKPFVSRY